MPELIETLAGIALILAIVIITPREYLRRHAARREAADQAYLDQLQETERLRKLARLHRD